MATVVVTGANRGIGLAFAKAYAARGDRVIGAVRDPSAAGELASFAQVVRCDVQDDGSVRALGAELAGVPVDRLVNNAGILRVDSLDQFDPAVMLQQFDTNAVGPLRVAIALRSNLRAAPAARVVNVTSRMGSIDDNTSGRMYGYRASKAALNMVTRSLAIDLAPIVVVAVHPGMVRTEMIGGHGDIDPDDAVARLLPLVEGLDPAKTGTFWHRDGYELPW